MCYVFYVALSLAFFSLGYFSQLVAIEKVNQFKGLNKWISTNATIISAYVTHERGRKYTTFYCYSTFEYGVNGIYYSSSKYNIASNYIRKKDDAHPCSGYKVGDVILCFYNPSNPSESVIKKEGIFEIAFVFGISVSTFCMPFYAAFFISKNLATAVASAGIVFTNILFGFLFLIYSSFGSYDSIGIDFSTFSYLFGVLVGVMFWSLAIYMIYSCFSMCNRTEISV